MLNSQNPDWSQPVLLEIRVRSNDDDTFETNLCCALSECGKTVDIDSEGPKAVQNVSCDPQRSSPKTIPSASHRADRRRRIHPVRADGSYQCPDEKHNRSEARHINS